MLFALTLFVVLFVVVATGHDLVVRLTALTRLLATCIEKRDVKGYWTIALRIVGLRRRLSVPVILAASIAGWMAVAGGLAVSRRFEA